MYKRVNPKQINHILYIYIYIYIYYPCKENMDKIQGMYMHTKQMILNSIIWIHANDVGLTRGEHMWWFLSFVEPSLKGLSPNHT